jgi:hypothetical protein
MRIEQIPSSLVVQKRVNTLDTQFAQLEGQLAANPFKKNSGFFDFGKYTQAPENKDFAIIEINQIWNKPIKADLDSEEEDSDINLNDDSSNSSEEDPAADRRDRKRKASKKSKERKQKNKTRRQRSQVRQQRNAIKTGRQ